MPACGAVLGGKYRILRAIGEGGMGAVFEAENLLTLKRAAVKWLHPRFMPRASAQERMLREARATSRIRHRNVVDLYDVVLEGSAVVLVMELLVGELLAHRLKRVPTPLPQLIDWLLQAMEGVSAAHAVGVVHRDIKPENIFLAQQSDRSELVSKVIDFGISKASGPEMVRLTQSGMAVGTPRYISFEQLRGDPDVDARSDVYAFGVILYEALLGRAPYEANSLGEQAVQFLIYDPPPPKLLRPELPSALSELAVRAIARDRDLRFESMDQLVAALRPFADERTYSAPLLVWEGAPALPVGAARPHLSTVPAATRGAARPAPPPLQSGELAPLVEPARKTPDKRVRASLLAVSLVLSVSCLVFWPDGGALSAAPQLGSASAREALPQTKAVPTPAVAEADVREASAAAADPSGRLSSVLVSSLGDAGSDTSLVAVPAARPAVHKKPAAVRPAPPRPLRRAQPGDSAPNLEPTPDTTGQPEESRHRAGKVARDEF